MAKATIEQANRVADELKKNGKAEKPDKSMVVSITPPKMVTVPITIRGTSPYVQNLATCREW